MDTYTPENLPIIPAFTGLNNSGNGKNEDLLVELDIPENEQVGVRKVLEQLDSIHFSPRASTLKAVMQQITQDHAVTH